MQPKQPAKDFPSGASRARQLFSAVIARADVDDLVLAQVLMIASRLEGTQPPPPPIPFGPASVDVVGDLEAAGRLLIGAAGTTDATVDALLLTDVARDVSDLIERMPARPTPP